MAPTDVRIGAARIRFTGRAEGDLGLGAADPPAIVELRRRAVLDLPWSWARQVHGRDVVVVPGATPATDAEADALVTTSAGVAVAVFTADCAPIGLVGARPHGEVVAAVHAGWRGLVGGVVQAAADVMRSHGATSIGAAVGPTIHPECYAFSRGDLDEVATRFGDAVRGLTAAGEPALDVPAAVRAALAETGVELVYDAATCTACNEELYSHRGRGDRERQAMVIWRM